MLVQISSGKIRGAVANDVISFKGIPYTKPPVGELRWRAPQSVESWEGVQESNAFSPSCMQTDDLPKSEIA
jgi:para-nitrobenzyl esterase